MQASEDLRVYKMDQDLQGVLHNIVNVFNSDAKKKASWNLNPKEQCWCAIRFQGEELQLKVESLKGGWRYEVRDAIEMEQFLLEIKAALKLAEKDLRAEFKKATGKNLRWSKGREWADYQPVAPNGLYRFFACKSGPVTVSLGGQKWVEKGPDIVTGEENEEGSHHLISLLTLPEKWR